MIAAVDEWKYSDVELEILVQVSWNDSISEDARATDCVSATGTKKVVT